MTAPEDAEAAVSGPLKITKTFDQVGTAKVSGAKVGVKGTLRVESSAAGAAVISGSEKAVELSEEASLADNCRLYGSTEENGSPDTVAVYNAGQKTYTVNGVTAKKLVSGPKAVVAVTPGDTLSVMAGEAQEYTARYTAEGVVSGSVKGLGDLQATVENGDANDITVNVAENAADGTWKVTVQTAESTPLGTYTLNLSSAVDGAVSGSVQFTVSKTKYAASVNGTNYRSLSAAVDAAKNVNGTVTLLDNVTDSITVTDGTFTIDLNGKTWSGTSSSYALTVNGGEVTVSSTGGAGTIVSSFSNSKHAIWINGGMVHLKENVNLKECLFIDDENGGSVTFEPGVTVTQNIMTRSSYITKFLTGRALQNDGKDYVPFYNVRTNLNRLGYVTVVDHPTHHMVDGVCDQCGFACDHSKAEKGAAACNVCGAKFIATATAADGTTKKRYTNADAALAAAAGNAKVTFVPGTYTLKNTVIFSGRIETEIDLNGATLQYASGDQGVVLQIMESYENITITLKNGTVQNTGEGTGIYLYKGSTLTLENVTVIGGMDTSFNTRQAAVYVANCGNNTLTVKSGSFSGPLNLNLADNTVKLYGGTYQNGIKTYDKTAEDYAALLDNSDPAKQYAYADGATEAVISYETVAARMNDRDSTNNSIQVVPHKHTMNDSACTQCGFVCTAHQYKNGVCAICQAACPHANVDTSTRVCSDCGLTMVAAVTVKDSENNEVTTYTADLAAAMNKAADGTTFTLLADVDNARKTACVTGNDKTVTLELAGHTITGGWIHVGKDQDNKISTSSTLKITGTGSFTTNGNLSVGESATLDLSGWTGGEISAVNMSQDKTNPDNESTLTVEAGGNQMGGSIGSLKFFNWPSNKISKTKLTCGTYGEIRISMNQESSISFSDLLAEGYAFQYTDGSGFVNYGTKASCSEGIGIISNVKVVKCTTHETEGESANCIYCNADAAADAAAKVQTEDGRTVYCTDLPSAFDKANAASGTVTITLLQDVTGLDQVLELGGAANWKDNDITLDLNGKTLSGTGGDSSNFLVADTYGTVTIRDSGTDAAKTGLIQNTKPRGNYAVYVSTGKLIIEGGSFESADDDTYGIEGYALGSGATLIITGGTFNSQVYIDTRYTTTISGGTFTSLQTYDGSGWGSASPISSLLANGYGFKKNGAWLTEAELAKTSATNVTVEAAPLHSVRLTANKTSAEYGLSGEITLTANYEFLVPDSSKTVTTKWYRVENGAPVEFTNPSVSCRLPSDLDAGTYAYRIVVTDDTSGYSMSSADFLITVTKADLSQGAAVFTQVANEYGAMGNIGDGKGTFVFTPWGGKTDSATEWSYLFEVSCNGRKLTEGSDYTITGGNTAAYAGKYTLTIEGRGNYTGTATHQWEIKPYTLSKDRNVARIVRAYDGTTNLSAEELIELGCFSENLENRNSKNPSLGADQGSITIRLGAEDFEVSNVKLSSAEAGDTTASFTIKLKPRPGQTAANFVFEDGTSEMTVKEMPVPTTKAFLSSSPKAGKLNVANDHAGVYTLDLSKLLPKLESPKEYGAVTYEISEIKLDDRYYTSGAKVENGKLILPIQAVKTSTESNIGTVKVNVTSGNIVDFPLLINVDATNKIVPTGEPTLSTKTLTYGQALSAIKLSGTMKDDGKTVPGTFAWVDGTVKPNAGSYEAAWKFTPADGDTYIEADGTVTITVNKAKPTGDPIYTKITAAKKTLADANLKPNTSWPEGTIQWVDKDGKELPDTTEVKANTEYQWKFIPADTANYNEAAGTLTLWARSSGGSNGGGGAAIGGTTAKADTVTNPDGSTTKTETKADGTVVETTTAKDGSTTVTETKKDGSSVTESKDANGSTGTVKTDANGQTEASAKISDKAVSDAKNSGEAVKVPAEVKAGTNSNSAPTVKVELPAGSGETKIEIPVSNVNTGTVAVIVHPDGTEEIMKDSIPTENGVQLTVSGDATVKVLDNSKNFTDTPGHWSEKNIDFVSARGLLNGTSADRFSPNAPTTRAQLWTVLARQADADLTGGASWFEKAQAWSKDNGISDGTNPSGAISRAQMVAMLWRAAGSPAPKTAENRFSDVMDDSYYADAVAWAVENGVTTGTKDGRFDPYASCTRAQIAAFLYRLYLSR